MNNPLIINFPYTTPDKNQHIIVKIVDDRGIESLRMIGVEQ